MGWIGCVCCAKFWRDIVAQTFALVQNVSPPTFARQPNGCKCTKTVQNAPKHEFKGPIGWIGCVRRKNNPTRLRGTNFCTSSACFAPSFVRQPNGPKCTQMVRNTQKHEFRVQWGISGAFVVINFDATSWHKLFALVRNVLPRVS